jgi:ABC-type amino acid transport substrate-binding protein
MLRRRAVVTAGLALLVSPKGHAAPLPTLVPGVLRIGTYFDNPPLEFLDNGKEIGYEIDLMNDIARRLDLRPLYVNTHWEKMLREIQEHRYDCIIGGITITPSRERKLAWSVPYMTTTLSLIVNAAKTSNITGIADLKTALVGVQASTTDYDIAVVMQKKGEIGKVVVYPFERIADAITDLKAGHITAVMKVAPVATYLVHREPNLKIIAQIPNDPQPLGIGFAKDESTLERAVNGALASMRIDGALARLGERWGVLS